MAYTIRYLGRKKKGDRINVSLNKNEVCLKLINEKQEIETIKVENGKANFLIPENGLWILKCKEKKELYVNCEHLKISVF